MAKRKLAPVDVAKRQSTLLVLFIPSTDRAGREIDQMPWVDKMLSILGELFGGATAFPRGRGVWRDDAQRGNLVFDDPVVINCYTNDDSILEQSPALVRLLKEMGQATKQGAVGFVIDKTYYRSVSRWRHRAKPRSLRKASFWSRSFGRDRCANEEHIFKSVTS